MEKIGTHATSAGWPWALARLSSIPPTPKLTRTTPLTIPAENQMNYKLSGGIQGPFLTDEQAEQAWRPSGGQPDHEYVHRETDSQDSETGSPAGPPPETTAIPMGPWTFQGAPILLDPPTVKDFSPVKTYDVRECQLILHLSKGKTLQFIRQHILPIPGAVALVGRKYLVHQWALNHALLQRSVSPRPLNLDQSSRAKRHLKRRGQLPLTSSETPSTSSGEKSST